jgi:hypothetical protein
VKSPSSASRTITPTILPAAPDSSEAVALFVSPF